MTDEKIKALEMLKDNHTECKSNLSHDGRGDCLLYLVAKMNGKDPQDAFLYVERFKYIVAPVPYDAEPWTPYLIEMFSIFVNGEEITKDNFQ